MENIIKVSISIKHTKEATKNLKIDIINIEIKVKKENYTILDARYIIPLLQTFYVYIQIHIFLAAYGNKLQIQLALGRYAIYQIIL